ncbi:AraC family transcriptional regulator [Paenibacillus thalictri]|uniref:AraC family transcriptional regulator n=1 Tax=Paenibacillus thalictri TaxID=2527873 RepID=A0A4Q9DEY5_9BACL|nr:helix-turn-helix domain-containing protein [Paenibacillus thalictri]TBL70332.1 AraC family transcriptional regulator [Paenibacillus thalictri]
MIHWRLLFERRQAKGHTGDYFRQSLLLILLIAFIPSVFISITNYWIGVHQLEKQVLQSHRLKFEQFSETMNKQFDQIALVMSRWSTNPLFSETLDGLKFIDHIDRMQELMQSLLVVSGSNMFIQEAQLFLNGQKAIIASDGIRYLNEDVLQSYTSVLHEKQGLFLTYRLPVVGSQDKTASQVSIIFKLPWHSEKPFGAFVLNMNKKEIQQAISHIREDESDISFLIQNTGDWVVPPDSPEKELTQRLGEVVLGRNTANGAFTYQWNGESYLVSYGKVTKPDWLFVDASPLSKLTKPVLQTSRLIMVCSLIGILAALLFAWVVSRKLYRPIGRLVQLLRTDKPDETDNVRHELEFVERRWSSLNRESRTLRERLKMSLPSLRDGFLLQLVQGHLYAWDEQDLKGRMEQLGWNAGEQLFSMLFIQLSGLDDQNGRFKEDDRQLISFAAANIVEEIGLGKNSLAHAVNFQDLSVGLLYMLPQTMKRDSMRKELHTLAQELSGTLGKVLGLHVTVIVCRITDHISEIPDLLEQAKQAVRYRDLQESYQIIDLEEYVNLSQTAVQYPFALEKDFLHAMRLGLAQEAHFAFREFMRDVREHSDKELMIHQAVFQLLGSVRHILIELGFTEHPLFMEGQHFEELIALREPAAAEKWFKQRILDPYFEQYLKSQKQQSHRLMERATSLLQEHYMEDLSLEECAERLSASPYTLSRTFKQITGVNFVDFLMTLRIEKAKELLIGTQLKISEVARQVGYQHSYFNKIFKGTVGLTPTQYREQYRNLD